MARGKPRRSIDPTKLILKSNFSLQDDFGNDYRDVPIASHLDKIIDRPFLSLYPLEVLYNESIPAPNAVISRGRINRNTPKMLSIALLLLVQATPVNPSVQNVVNYLAGEMDTTAQARENPKIAEVRMTTCEVSFPNSANSVYLYQEQALLDKLNQPYRQRFLEIKPGADGRSIESSSYKPRNAPNFINFCNKSLTERQLQPSDLGESICTVILTPIEGGYKGETPPAGCPTTARGAVRITNTIILRPDGMDTSDRGYDANGRQIWGARDNFYQFRRVNR